MEHRKLAVDLAEVIIKWEMQRIKDDQENTGVIEVGKNSMKITDNKYNKLITVWFFLLFLCK